MEVTEITILGNTKPITVINDVHVLGTPYKVKIMASEHDADFENYPELNGYCDPSTKTLAIRSAESLVEHQKGKGYLPVENPHVDILDTIRHEIVHAFMNESGIDANSTKWAHDEQLVDWLVQMMPRIESLMQSIISNIGG